MKIRSGLFYTKTMMEYIMNIFEDLNCDEIFNIDKYNNYEYLLNDNNIFDIYNSTLCKLNEINEDSKILLEEQNEYFYKELIKIYSLDKDYYPFLKEYEKILKGENNTYINYIKSKFEFIDEIINEFNNTLFQQKNEYNIYNIDKNNTLKKTYEDYLIEIQNTFNKLKNNITSFKNNSYFLNSFRRYLTSIQKEKINDYKIKINELVEEQKHNYQLLNMTLDLGLIIGNMLKTEYDKHEFLYVIEYIQIIDVNINNFLNNITGLISTIEKDFQQKLKDIYNDFLTKLNNDISFEVDQNYVDELNNNYTKCLNNLMKSFEESSDEMKIDCENKNYYNYSVKIYFDFDEKYKSKLNDLMNKIINIDYSNDLEKFLLYDYFENNYKLENYIEKEKLFDEIKENFFYYDDIVAYINFTENKFYFDYLYDLLKKSFKPSYTKYINNYLISPLIDNITVFINNYAEINLDYLINKIDDEFNYYVLILNNTRELGVNSMQALTILYDEIKRKLDQSIYYTINEYIIFYINLFNRRNSHIFSNNYITYYSNKLNQYKIEIHQLNEIIDEIMYDGTFNKTINNYSNELMSELIISKMNNSIKQLIDNKLSQVYFLIDDYKNKMINIISNIGQNEDNQKINNITNEYQIILLNQNNQFIFKVSESPFNELYSFIKNVLEPPLVKIKQEYNLIEEKILEDIQNIVDTFPDIKEIIKEKLDIENTLEYIKSILEETKDLLLKYKNDLNEDYDSYINKLMHYTYINGLDTYDKSCTDSYCGINVTKIKSVQRRRLGKSQRREIVKKRKLKNQLNINLTKINERKNKNIDFKRKLSISFDSTMGSLSNDDVIPFLLDIKDTIFKLNESYINNFDINAKKITNNFINKVNGAYLVRLDRIIGTSVSKFAPILSEDALQTLKDKLYNGYYKLKDYLSNATKYLEEDVDDLIKRLNNTSDFLGTINYNSYNKMIAYLNTLKNIIDSKYTIITNGNNNKNLRNDEEDEEEEEDDDYDVNYEFDDDTKNAFTKIFEDTQKSNQIVFAGLIKITEKFDMKAEKSLENSFNQENDEEEVDEEEDDISLELSIKVDENGLQSLGLNFAKELKLLDKQLPIPPFILFFPSFPVLQMRIVPVLKFGLTFTMGAELDILEKEFSIYFDISAKAIVSINLEVGIYIPPFPCPVETSLTVGIQGILGSGQIGMKISLFIIEPKIVIFLYMEFNAMQFTFYILFKVKIEVGFFKISIDVYLMHEKLTNGFGYKKTKKITCDKNLTIKTK